MGIRIHKSIGYFIPKNKIKSIIVPNYEDILNSFSEKDSLKEIMNNLNKLVKSLSKEEKLYYDLSIVGELSEDDIENCVKRMNNVDQFKGLFFKTQNDPERYSENIDFYSCTKKELSECKFKQKKILSPIYPVYGYIYTGTNDIKIKEEIKKKSILIKNSKNGVLEIGAVTEVIISPLGHSILGKDAAVLTNGEIAKKLGCFVPNFAVYIYYLSLASGLLKEGVSLIDFAKTITPSVITHWG